MIANKSAADREVIGNLTGEDIQMGVADIAHILNVVTDLYSDRELACIREYSTNALDAHIEAGITAPIEVTTPGPLEPFLTIRDFGIGLALDDIREIYSQYGASTKRNTNSQTGMLGLGCKSALTYSDQFTVTSVKDGVRIQVVVSRNAKGASMKVVDTADTDQPNGTTVMIPARAYNEFERKAKDFFKRWRPGTVKLNGVEPEFMPGAQWVTDKICINAEQSNQSYVVMGGVPYPVRIETGLGYYTGITAFVDIGSIDFAPSREQVMDTDTTQQTLTDVKSAFRQGLHKAIEKDIADAGSAAEAAMKLIEWRSKVGQSNMPPSGRISYKGKQVPDSFECEFPIIVAPRYGRKMNAHTNYRVQQFLPLPNINGSVWVTGFDYVSYTATVKKKLEKWVEDNNIALESSNFILATTNKKPDTTWIQNITFVDWQTIKAIKLPKNVRSTSSGRIPGSYDIFESGDLNEDVPADDIDTTHDLFWMVGKYYEGRNVASFLNSKFPGCTLVMMREGRQDKFQRLFPKARDARKVIRDAYKAWTDSIDKDDALAIHMRHNADGRLKHMDLKRVDDPEVARARRVMDRDTSKLDDQIAEWRTMGYYYTPDEDSDLDDPLDKYILLPESYYFDRYMKRHADAIYRYMNCEYAHRVAQDGS